MSLSRELRELSELHEAGALSDSEFSEAKRLLLGKKQLEDPSQKSAVSTEDPPSMEWESENRDSGEAEEDVQVALKRPWGLVAYASINIIFAFLAIGSLLSNLESFSKIPYGYAQLYFKLIGACTLAGSSVAFLKGSRSGRILLLYAAGFYFFDRVVSLAQVDEISRQLVGVPATHSAIGLLRHFPALIWLLFPLAKSKWMRSLSESEDWKPMDWHLETRKGRVGWGWRGCFFIFLSCVGGMVHKIFEEPGEGGWLSFFFLMAVGRILYVRARSEERRG